MPASRITTVEDAIRGDGYGRATTVSSATLEQRVLRLRPGERFARELDGRSEIVFVAAGRAILRADGERYELDRWTGAFVAADDEGDVAATEDEPLELVRVLMPAADAVGPRVARYADQQADEAGIGREFRLLVQCSHATQFVGLVPPGRAKMHNHPYDEVSYVVEGTGVVHWDDGGSVPVGPGSCIYFPRLVFHSLENVGTEPLRIMGVFHPAGSPADRIAELDY